MGTHFACPDPNSLSGSGSVDLIESRFQIQSRSGYKTLAAEYIEHYSSVPNCIRRVHYLLVFPDPESQFFIPDLKSGGQKGHQQHWIEEEFQYFKPKNVTKLSEIWAEMFIPDPDFSIPETGQKSTGSCIPDPGSRFTRQLYIHDIFLLKVNWIK